MTRVVFGEFELDEERALLRTGGLPVKLHPKPLAVLVYLMRNRDRVVSRDELLEAVWPGVSVSDQAVWSAVRDLRRALGDTDTAARIIETIRGQGFRFVAQLADCRAGGGGLPPVQPEAARAVAPPVTDFVDREEPMAALRASLAAAERGDMRASFIAGAAGMGKTRLSLELSAEARALGFEVLVGRCFDREAATSFWPWLQVIRELLRSEVTAGVARSEIARLPELAFIEPEPGRSSPPPASHADLDRSEARLRFFDAAGVFLRRVSATRPLLIVLDDLHWADEASLLLLEWMMGALNGARIHLVAAFRDPPLPPRALARALAYSGQHGQTERIDLTGLRREAVSFLLETAAAQAPDPALIEAVLSATGGNPLFVSELAKLALDGQLDVAAVQRGLPVPKRVRDVLRWQLDRLSEPCQGALQLLSVAGSEVDLAVLAEALDAAPSDVLDAVSEAETVGLVRADPQTTRFAFAHDLVRESIYSDLPVARRARLHRRMAEALETTMLKSPGADLGQIAYQYALGAADGAAERAVHFGHLAGRQANARMAYEDAVAHYERALRALPLIGEPDPKLTCELLLAQAEAAWGTLEDAASVQERFVAAADAARAAGAPELLARAALGRSGRGAGPGDYRDMMVIDNIDIALLTEAHAALGSGETELRALLLARLSLAVRYNRGFTAADELSAEAVRIAEALNATETLAEVLRYRHEVLAGPKFARESLALAGRMLELARAVRSRPLEMDALLFQTRDGFVVLDPVGGPAGEAYDALAATMKHPAGLLYAGMRSVFVRALHGMFAAAEREAHEFYERDRGRNMAAAGTFELQMIMLGMLRGDHATANAMLARLAERRRGVPWIECALVRQHAFAGRRAEAESELARLAAGRFRTLEERYEHSCLGAYFMLAEACAELGDARHADVLYECIVPYQGLMASPFLGTIWHGSMMHALGLTAALLGRADQAQQHFEAALFIANALASPPMIAMAQERLGRLLLQNDRDTARGNELVARALEGAERLGMRDVARRCGGRQSDRISP